jgi:hypothetical protein
MDDLIEAIQTLTKEVSLLRSELVLQKGKSILLKERQERKDKAASMMAQLEKRKLSGDC